MPRLARQLQLADYYHVINRGNLRAQLFDADRDYLAFIGLLDETIESFGLPVLAYCLMPNHWHLVVMSVTPSILSRSMHWLTGTHAVRWSKSHERPGPGHVYQGRFKSVPVQPDASVWRVARYVESNARSAKFVRHAEDWPWCSASQRIRNCERPRLQPLQFGPLESWLRYVNQESADEDIRAAVRRGRPIGSEEWITARREALGLPPLRPRGRPRREK